jgi:hypothetical protein
MLVLVLGGQFVRGTSLGFLDIIGNVLEPAAAKLLNILIGT